MVNNYSDHYLKKIKTYRNLIFHLSSENKNHKRGKHIDTLDNLLELASEYSEIDCETIDSLKRYAITDPEFYQFDEIINFLETEGPVYRQ